MKKIWKYCCSIFSVLIFAVNLEAISFEDLVGLLKENPPAANGDARFNEASESSPIVTTYRNMTLESYLSSFNQIELPLLRDLEYHVEIGATFDHWTANELARKVIHIQPNKCSAKDLVNFIKEKNAEKRNVVFSHTVEELIAILKAHDAKVPALRAFNVFNAISTTLMSNILSELKNILVDGGILIAHHDLDPRHLNFSEYMAEDYPNHWPVPYAYGDHANLFDLRSSKRRASVLVPKASLPHRDAAHFEKTRLIFKKKMNAGTLHPVHKNILEQQRQTGWKIINHEEYMKDKIRNFAEAEGLDYRLEEICPLVKTSKKLGRKQLATFRNDEDVFCFFLTGNYTNAQGYDLEKEFFNQKLKADFQERNLTLDLPADVNAQSLRNQDEYYVGREISYHILRNN